MTDMETLTNLSVEGVDVSQVKDVQRVKRHLVRA